MQPISTVFTRSAENASKLKMGLLEKMEGKEWALKNTEKFEIITI